jgi:hypothetical protein
MTLELVNMLRNRFEVENPIEDIFIYENNERIYINLSSDVYIQNAGRNLKEIPLLESDARFRNIADKIFDVDFLYEKEGNIGPAFFFKPSTIDIYSQNHTYHYLQVHLPATYPLITISTGNRGETNLLPEQRAKYFAFVEQTYGVFLDRLILLEINR